MAKPMLRRLGVRLMVYVLLGIVVWIVAVTVLQRSVLFPRHAIGSGLPHGPGRGVEVWTVPTPDGPVHAWFVPGIGAAPDRPRPAVIFAHGNAELIDHNLDLAGEYQAMGVSVLMPEYRGYGNAAGRPSQEAIVADFVSFYDQLAARPDVDAQGIVVHGRSLGGAVAAQVAAQRPVQAMVLESTFTSVRAMAGRYLVPPFLVRDPFDTLTVVRDFDGPVLVIHGTTDNIVPSSHADQLAAAAQQATLVKLQGGHNDMIADDLYWGPINALLQEAGIIRSPRQAVDDTAEPAPEADEPPAPSRSE